MVRLKVNPVTISRRGCADLALPLCHFCPAFCKPSVCSAIHTKSCIILKIGNYTSIQCSKHGQISIVVIAIWQTYWILFTCWINILKWWNGSKWFEWIFIETSDFVMSCQTAIWQLLSSTNFRHFGDISNEMWAFPRLLLNWARVWKTMVFCGHCVVIFGPYWGKRAKFCKESNGGRFTNWKLEENLLCDFPT